MHSIRADKPEHPADKWTRAQAELEAAADAIAATTSNEFEAAIATLQARQARLGR